MNITIIFINTKYYECLGTDLENPAYMQIFDCRTKIYRQIHSFFTLPIIIPNDCCRSLFFPQPITPLEFTERSPIGLQVSLTLLPGILVGYVLSLRLATIAPLAGVR